MKVNSAQIKHEKLKARELRKSGWWQSLVANGVCYYCENKIPEGRSTMDHVVPISKGGKSTKGNIVLSCKECNTRKHSQTAVDLILNSAQLGTFS